MLFEQILALLLAQFAGVRKDGLTQLARSLALTVDTEEKAKEVVGKLTADQVNKFVQDWRKDADAEITKANKTYEDGLKEKYDFVEKGTPEPSPTPAPTGGLSAEDVSKIVTEAVTKATAGLQEKVTAMETAKLTAEREAQLKAVLDDSLPQAYKDAIIEGFKARNFETPEAFTEYLNTQKTAAASFQQELADKGLRQTATPNFGTVNKDGVSAGVESYIKDQQQANGGNLSGKSI